MRWDSRACALVRHPALPCLRIETWGTQSFMAGRVCAAVCCSGANEKASWLADLYGGVTAICGVEPVLYRLHGTRSLCPRPYYATAVGAAEGWAGMVSGWALSSGRATDKTSSMRLA
jgi:hypothetical protein